VRASSWFGVLTTSMDAPPPPPYPWLYLPAMAAVVRSRSREEIVQARDVALLAKRKVLRLSSEPAGVCALASVRRKGLWASLDIFHWAHGPNGLFTFYMPSLPGNPIYFLKDFSYPTFHCLRLVQIISSVESSQLYLLPPPAPFSPCAAAPS
jgi:hypothetical protein